MQQSLNPGKQARLLLDPQKYSFAAMKDMSLAEIIVTAALVVLPVIMGVALVVVAVCSKSGTTDVETWSEDDEEADLELGPKSDASEMPSSDGNLLRR